MCIFLLHSTFYAYIILTSAQFCRNPKREKMKLLNLTQSDRSGCSVTYNVNRFEVYHAHGWLLTAANNKADLKAQLAANGIFGAKFDGAAQRKYMGV